jgi:hypothetical protein
MSLANCPGKCRGVGGLVHEFGRAQEKKKNWRTVTTVSESELEIV